MRNFTTLVTALALAMTDFSTAEAQAPRQMDTGEIAAGIRRLGVVGSVLYIAAHPDDENTKFLAWAVGAKGMRAGYLSLTRGDGGQNLIGTEQDEVLGLIRTHELLAARRIDGAEQMFTRARDFGFSKSADETLKIWGHDAVLADVVFAIRRFRPDVIIARFNTKPPNHGHHTASAILAEEAFAAAADPTRFPEQLQFVKPWKADRLLHNVSTWNLPKDADLSMHVLQDVGAFDPLSGRAWGELAALSRTQHKSQGFGVAAERGPLLEYFSHVAGTAPKKEIFEGLDFTWKRFAGTESITRNVENAFNSFNAREPHLSIPALLAIRDALIAIDDDNPWKFIKLRETEELITACAGLFAEARAADPIAVPGSPVSVELTVINRSPSEVSLLSAALPDGQSVDVKSKLANNALWKAQKNVTLAPDVPISTPYWLREPFDGGLFRVRDPSMIGRPVGDPTWTVAFDLEVAGKRMRITRPVVHAWTDPVRGELYRAFEAAPPVTATLDRAVVMVPNGATQTVNVVVAAGKANANGAVRLELPPGYFSEPIEAPFTLANRGDEKTVSFKITPRKGATEREAFKVLVDLDGRVHSWRQRSVNHEHIPPLTIRQPSEGVLVPVSLTTKIKRIGYIPGPGDKVAESLANVGYDVTLLPEERLATDPLKGYDAILVGVRAFNANPRLANYRDKLLAYVEKGGRVVVQYNTNSRIGPLTVPIGPHPLEIGRDRITDETAAMTPLDPAHPMLTKPNKLTSTDYDGWVQERGLYFASKWDEKYTPIFSMQDPAEQPLVGGVLMTRHGKGVFIYTGLAFFRQLPAGVPGAYRLLANMLAQ